MIRYAITHRDRLAYRLACLALRLATPSYRAFVMTCSQRGVRDLYLNPPTPEDVQLIDGPGCTDACSEMHTFEPPCEQAIGDRSDGSDG